MKSKIKLKRLKLGKWLMGITAMLFTGFIIRKKSKKPSVKLLSEDGKLVEISQHAQYQIAGKINKDEIHNWIKK